MDSDAAKFISDDSSSDPGTLKSNEGTKFRVLKKPMFSLFDVIVFSGKINQIFRAGLPVSSV